MSVLGMFIVLYLPVHNWEGCHVTWGTWLQGMSCDIGSIPGKEAM